MASSWFFSLLNCNYAYLCFLTIEWISRYTYWWMTNCKLAKGSGRGPLEVVSRNLVAGTEGDDQQHRNNRWLGSDSKTRYPESYSTALPLSKPASFRKYCNNLVLIVAAFWKKYFKLMNRRKLDYYSSIVDPNRWRCIKVVAISTFITTVFSRLTSHFWQAQVKAAFSYGVFNEAVSSQDD